MSLERYSVLKTLLCHLSEGSTVSTDVQPLALGGSQQAVGFVVTLLNDGHHSTGIVGLGRVTGMLQQRLGLQQVVLTDGDISQIDQRCRRVRIEIGGCLQATVIRVTTLLEGIGYVPQLTQ